MKWSRRRQQQVPGKAPVDVDVDFEVNETASGQITVTLPTGDVFVFEPGAERPYWRENVLAERVAEMVALRVLEQLKGERGGAARAPSEQTSAENLPMGLPEIDSQPQRKRGRPAEIPEERKKRALAARGGKARAAILYGTKYPTPQQVKNVSSILRHYLKQRESGAGQEIPGEGNR